MTHISLVVKVRDNYQILLTHCYANYSLCDLVLMQLGVEAKQKEIKGSFCNISAQQTETKIACAIRKS